VRARAPCRRPCRARRITTTISLALFVGKRSALLPVFIRSGDNWRKGLPETKTDQSKRSNLASPAKKFPRRPAACAFFAFPSFKSRPRSRHRRPSLWRAATHTHTYAGPGRPQAVVRSKAHRFCEWTLVPRCGFQHKVFEPSRTSIFELFVLAITLPLSLMHPISSHRHPINVYTTHSHSLLTDPSRRVHNCSPEERCPTCILHSAQARGQIETAAALSNTHQHYYSFVL
jgi:hypothetical protein